MSSCSKRGVNKKVLKVPSIEQKVIIFFPFLTDFFPVARTNVFHIEMLCICIKASRNIYFNIYVLYLYI